MRSSSWNGSVSFQCKGESPDVEGGAGTCTVRLLKRLVRILLLLYVGTVLGCTGSGALAPIGRDPAIETSGRYHKVRRGETLYAIAWRHGLDYRQLAAWNGIAAPYVIYPGQTLRLRAVHRRQGHRVKRPAGIDTGASRSAGSASTRRRSHSAGPGATSEHERPAQRSPSSAGNPVRSRGDNAKDIPSARLKWHWPARGKVVSAFGEAGRKGVDIEGSLGQPILAASDGRVVYSGDGLLRYGKLIIIKHNGEFLSAYAHNNRLVVEEGEPVARGQRIAEMGRSGTSTVMLHFEIRRNGTPVDPMRYLPK